MSGPHRVFCHAVVALCAAVLAYGVWEGRLFAQPVWSEIGRQRFLGFAAAYAALAALLLVWRPRWLVPAILGSAVTYTFAATGPRALPAVLLVLVSAWCVGGVLPGLALIVTAISLTAALPIHYTALYACALAIPVGLRGKSLWPAVRRDLPEWLPATPARAAAAALALFPLLCHWLVVLKPEASADGLAMHLVIPARMAMDHRWSFDVGQFTWAVMPMGVDWAYTATYLLGGEAAARLLNFASLCLCALLVLRILRRWVSETAALAMTALFLSSPIVQLVTGSLFVENLWTAMVLGGLLSIIEFSEGREASRLYQAALVLGTAVAMKLAAAVFAGVLLVIGVVELLRRPSRHWPRTLAAMAAIFLAFACVPYVTAWHMTGNPVFPYANTVFHSPYFDSTAAWVDPRYRTPVSLGTAYGATFHTATYLEGNAGGFAFQWMFLLPVAAAILGRRRWPWPAAPLTAGVVFCFYVILSGQSYLRYIYPLVALATIPVAVAWQRLDDRTVRAAAATLGAATFCLNLWFLPASGWYHKDFFLNQVFDASDVDRYLRVVAPARPIVAYLNRKPQQNFRVGFLEDNAIGDLRAPAVSNTWHSDAFYRALRASGSPEEDLAIARRFNLDYFIGLDPDAERVSQRLHTPAFLERYTDPEYRSGPYDLLRLRDSARAGRVDAVHAETPVALPGPIDDTSNYLAYSGPWIRDNQFPQPVRGTLTYSDQKEATVRLRFGGTAVTWVFTKAFNRGIGEVTIDGETRGKVDQYSSRIEWQSAVRYGPLSEGIHTLTVRVTGEKSAASQGAFVDVDQFVIAQR